MFENVLQKLLERDSLVIMDNPWSLTSGGQPVAPADDGLPVPAPAVLPVLLLQGGTRGPVDGAVN